MWRVENDRHSQFQHSAVYWLVSSHLRRSCIGMPFFLGRLPPSSSPGVRSYALSSSGPWWSSDADFDVVRGIATLTRVWDVERDTLGEGRVGSRGPPTYTLLLLSEDWERVSLCDCCASAIAILTSDASLMCPL